MNRLTLAFVLLILAGISAASPADVIKDYLQQGDTLATREIATSSGSYTVAVINGKDSMMVSDADSSIVTDSGIIYSALKEEYLSANKVSVDTAALASNINDFNASREPKEGDCERSVGVDRFPCTDFASCRYACLSVPLCRGIFEGQGDSFIYAIQNWRDGSAKIDQAISNFKDAASQIHDDPVMAGSASDYLLAIEARANDVQANKLFVPVISGGYEFCYQINFSFTKINSDKDLLSQINAVLSKLPGIEKNASIMQGITEQRIREKQASDVVYQYQETFAKVNENFTKTRDILNNALSLVSSDSLSGNLSALTDMRDGVGKLGDDKNYSGAIELGGSYFPLALSALLYSGKLTEDYNLILNGSASIGSSLQADRNLSGIGGYASKEYGDISSGFQSLSAQSAPPVPEALLPSLKSNMTALSSRLSRLEFNAKAIMGLLERINSAQANATDLSQKASAYRQNYDFAGINASLESAHNLTMGGNTQAAENSLKSATDAITAGQADLDGKIPAIDSARADYTSASDYLSQRRGASFLFLGADFGGAEGTCQKALDTIYSSPSSSEGYSKQCTGAADSALQNLEYEKYVIYLLFLVALYLFYRWARKREWGFVIG